MVIFFFTGFTTKILTHENNTHNLKQYIVNNTYWEVREDSIRPSFNFTCKTIITLRVYRVLNLWISLRKISVGVILRSRNLITWSYIITVLHPLFKASIFVFIIILKNFFYLEYFFTGNNMFMSMTLILLFLYDILSSRFIGRWNSA